MQQKRTTRIIALSEIAGVHPLARQLPEWPKDDPRFIALVDDIRSRGIDQKILVDRENRIVDGRNLWRAAKQLEIEEVEVGVVADEDIAGTLLAGIIHRRNLTKGQRAYLVYPFLEPAHQEAQRRKLAMLRKGNVSPSCTECTTGKTIQDFAEQIGVGRRLFMQAAEIHRLMASNKKFEWNDERKPLTLREYYEPRILDDDDPAGLGAVIAGIGAKLSPNTANQVKSGQLELFTHAFDTLKTRFTYWEKFTPKQKEQARPEIRAAVAAMPEDLRGEFEQAIKEANKKAWA